MQRVIGYDKDGKKIFEELCTRVETPSWRARRRQIASDEKFLWVMKDKPHYKLKKYLNVVKGKKKSKFELMSEEE